MVTVSIESQRKFAILESCKKISIQERSKSFVNESWNVPFFEENFNVSLFSHHFFDRKKDQELFKQRWTNKMMDQMVEFKETHIQRLVTERSRLSWAQGKMGQFIEDYMD